jgi:hypothetical protein
MNRYDIILGKEFIIDIAIPNNSSEKKCPQKCPHQFESESGDIYCSISTPYGGSTSCWGYCDRKCENVPDNS